MDSNQTIATDKKVDFPYNKYIKTYQILGGITLALIGLWIGSILFGSEQTFLVDNALAYWTNISTELLGVIITIVVINQFTIIRDREKLKKRLVRQAGSPSHAVATEAIARLREEGWLTGEDGLLKEADLTGANLEGANLSNANLQGAKLYRANLHRAILEHTNAEATDLREANLSNSRLAYANFDKAYLNNANLSNSTPWEASFQQANLEGANFRRANMPLANLSGANLKQTSFEGANLKSSKLIDVKFLATNLEGATMLRALVQISGGGHVTELMPGNQTHFPILPNGVAMAFTESNLEDFGEHIYESNSLTFMHYQDIDWNMFTSPSHSDYKDWHQEWLRKNHQ